MDFFNKIKPIIYTVMVVLFAVLAYVFINVGLNIKNKIIVGYQNDGEINYLVYLLENDIYDSNYLEMGDKYVSNLVDYVKFNFKYDVLYDEEINGYYSYSVDTMLMAYDRDTDENIFEKEDNILEDKIVVLDKNNTDSINIDDSVVVDYYKYKEMLDNFSNVYGSYVDGYLKVRFNIYTMLDFNSLDNDVEDTKTMEVLIPISDNMFTIDVNTYDGVDSYDDFSKKNFINYLYVALGLMFLAISLTFIVMIIRELMIVIKNQNNYNKELKRILKEYDEDIIIVKKFYNKKKYNLIYVDSFMELIDVCKKVGSPISYKELKKNYKSIFVIIDDDNAWIYRMIAR